MQKYWPAVFSRNKRAWGLPPDNDVTLIGQWLPAQILNGPFESRTG